MPLDQWMLIPTAFLLGLILGSFITMASWRLPRTESWGGRSHCSDCGQILKSRNLIPLLSWVIQKGLSACCGTKISLRYPLTEVATGCLMSLAAWRYGFTIDFLLLTFLIVILMIMIVVDLEHQIIPDSLNAVLAITGLSWQLWRGGDVWGAIAAGLILASLALLVAYCFEKIMKRESLGGGDIKFLAAAGLWTGFWLVPWLFIFGGVFGIVLGLIWRVVKKQNLFPFGPALCLALYIIVIFGEQLNFH